MKTNKPNFLILHHTAGIYANPGYDSSDMTLSQINEYHKSLRFNKSIFGYYAGYHYIIFKDGTLKQTRYENEMGCHTIGKNFNSLGICLVGNFSRIGENRFPSLEQQESFKNLLIRLMNKYDIPLSKVVGHRYFSQTECPGKNIGKKWIEQLLEEQLEESEDIKIELLKKEISLLQKLLALYTKILRLFSKVVLKGDKEDN